MDPKRLNSGGWDERVADGDVWTRPVDDDVIERARGGDGSMLLTPLAPIPRSWFGELAGARVPRYARAALEQPSHPEEHRGRSPTASSRRAHCAEASGAAIIS